MKHSPLPWTCNYPEIQTGTGSEKRSVLRVPTPDEFPELNMTEEQKKQCTAAGKANLEFICQLVNKHEEGVA